MKWIRIIPLISALTLCRVATAQDVTWSATYDQWKSALVEAQSRVHALTAHSRATDSLNVVLNRTEQSKPDIDRLADSLSSRASEIQTSTSQAKVAQDAYDTARRCADTAIQQHEANAHQFQDDTNRANAQAKQLDAEDIRLSAWSAKLDELHVRIEAERRPFQLPQEQAAQDAFNADVEKHNIEVAQYNTALATQKNSIAKYNTWRDQLLAVQKSITDDDKNILELRSIESRKKQERQDANDKLDKLTNAQSHDIAQLTALMEPSLAQLQGLIGALDSQVRMVAGFSYGGTPYSARQDDSSAQAVALTSATANDPDGRLLSRVFVLPPLVSSSPQQAAADVVTRQLITEMHADVLATQYKNIPVGTVTGTSAPTDVSGSTPLEVVADLSVAPAEMSGDSVVYLSETDLSKPLDPGSQISRTEYEAALATRARLDKLLPKLKAQLAKLKADPDKTIDYHRQIEELRAEIVRDAVRDMMAVMPVKGILSRLAENPKLAESLTPESIDQIELAMKQAESLNMNIAPIFTTMAARLPADSQDRLQTETIGKMYQVYSDFAAYVNDPKTGAFPNYEEAGDVAKFGIGVEGVFCAPVATGAGIESFGERGITHTIIRSAIDDLSASLNANVDAQVFLQEKIDRTQHFAQQLNGAVAGYESVKHTIHAAMSAQAEAE